jgi:hypothetical protein
MGVYLRVIIASANERICLSLTEGTFARSSNKMPMAVKAAIKNAAIKVGNMSDEEATDFLYLMERSGRLIEETWS